MTQKNLYLFLQIGTCLNRPGIPHFLNSIAKKASAERIKVLQSEKFFSSTSKLNKMVESNFFSPEPPVQDACLVSLRDFFFQELCSLVLIDEAHDKYFGYLDFDWPFSEKDFEHLFSSIRGAKFAQVNFVLLGYNIVDSLKYHYLQTFSQPWVANSSRLYSINDYFIDSFLRKLESIKCLLTSDFFRRSNFHFVDLDLLDAKRLSFGSYISEVLSLSSKSVASFNFSQRGKLVTNFIDPFFAERAKLDSNINFDQIVELTKDKNININSRWMGAYLDVAQFSSNYIKDFLHVLSSKLGIEFFKKTCFYKDSPPITFFEI